MLTDTKRLETIFSGLAEKLTGERMTVYVEIGPGHVLGLTGPTLAGRLQAATVSMGNRVPSLKYLLVCVVPLSESLLDLFGSRPVICTCYWAICRHAHWHSGDGVRKHHAERITL
jgi:hypothetical protein